MDSQPQRRLGRLYRPDPRDQAFVMSSAHLKALRKLQPIKARTEPWHILPPLDQGQTSECVIHAYLHFKRAAPFEWWKDDSEWPMDKRTQRYTEVQEQDGDPMPHDGTTARACLDVAKAHGEISEYLHINDEDLLQEVLRTRGPVMAGCDWFNTMYDTDPSGYLTPGGSLDGGHETLLRWYYPKSHKKYADSYEFENSWGAWGFKEKGIYRLTGEAFRYLYFQLNGDLMLPTDIPIVRRVA